MAENQVRNVGSNRRDTDLLNTDTSASLSQTVARFDAQPALDDAYLVMGFRKFIKR